MLTIVIGHATFFIVIVFNDLIARLRRTPGWLAEASIDLGGRGGRRCVRDASLDGDRLGVRRATAFGLSFDKVIVTVFTAGAHITLPLWISGAPARPAAT